MGSVSFFSSPRELCNLGFVHSFQILFSTCEMVLCVCVFQTAVISKNPTQNNKDYSFNMTVNVPAQNFQEGLTVEQMNYRNLGPELRNYDSYSDS